jgi:hypothetical protein
MHEGHLEPEHAAAGRGVDQLGPLLGQRRQRPAHVVDLVGDVVHARPPFCEEAADGGVLAERSEKLDPRVADPYRGRLDPLVVHALAVLEPAAEEPLVRRDGLVEVRHGNADVMDPACLHPGDATAVGLRAVASVKVGGGGMHRRALIGLLAVVAVIAAGCGGGSKSNGEASKSANQVVNDAKQAALGASAVHVVGSIVDAGQPLTLDLTIVKGKGGKGEMSESHLKFEIIRVGGTAYIKGSDEFLRKFAGSAAAALLKGKWLKGSATKGDLSALAPLTDISKLFNGALGSHGKLRNKGETTYKGHKAVAIEDTTQGGTLYVAATGTPYPIAIEGGKSKGAVTFTEWNKTASIEAPKGAIDMSKLGG